MKLLFDESVPRRLAGSFPQVFTVRTVQQMGWAGVENGPLMALAADDGIDAMITVDRGIEHQQNLNALPLPVILMLAPRNRLADLLPLVPRAIETLSSDLHQRIHRVTD